MKIIYAVYACDEHKNYNSMNVSNPLVITTSKRRMFRELLHNLTDSEFKKSTKIINSKLLTASKIYELNNVCKNYWITSFID